MNVTWLFNKFFFLRFVLFQNTFVWNFNCKFTTQVLNNEKKNSSHICTKKCIVRIPLTKSQEQLSTSKSARFFFLCWFEMISCCKLYRKYSQVQCIHSGLNRFEKTTIINTATTVKLKKRNQFSFCLFLPFFCSPFRLAF